MKHFLLLVAGYLVFTLNTYAQLANPGKHKTLVDFWLTSFDTCNNQLFREHPELKEIRLMYTGEQPRFISINNRQYFYDMKFKGDSLAGRYQKNFFLKPFFKGFVILNTHVQGVPEWAEKKNPGT